jgi:hypothetical protein
MRENRTYGSEGGEAKAFPTPISRGDTTKRRRKYKPGSRRKRRKAASPYSVVVFWILAFASMTFV